MESRHVLMRRTTSILLPVNTKILTNFCSAEEQPDLLPDPRFNQVCRKCSGLFGNVQVPSAEDEYPRSIQFHELRALLCKTGDRCHLCSLFAAVIHPIMIFWQHRLSDIFSLSPYYLIKRFRLGTLNRSPIWLRKPLFGYLGGSPLRMTLSTSSQTIITVCYMLLKDSPAMGNSTTGLERVPSSEI